MKVQDLQIGDWIYINPWDDEEPHYPDRVVGINYSSYQGKDYCDWVNCHAWDELGIEEIRPIPITVEILEANGFKNDFYEEETVADYVNVQYPGYSLRCKSEEWDDALVTWCNGHIDVVTDFHGEVRGKISFVHQLQQAFRFCVIDKEIEIKKDS